MLRIEDIKNNENSLIGRYFYFVVFLCISSYIFGFIFGEDSVGGARFDLFIYHWPAIQRFSENSWSVAVKDYTSATNPLLYMIFSALPIHINKSIYHIFSVSVAFITYILISIAYYRRFYGHKKDFYGIKLSIIGASLVLISPSFRSSSFWGSTDYFPFLFLALTSLLFSDIIQSVEWRYSAITIVRLILLLVISSLAFYTRQFYVFVPLIVVWVLLSRTTASLFAIAGVFALTMVPEFYLLYLWKGINPPSFQHHTNPSLGNILLIGANVGLFSIPIITGCLYARSLRSLLPSWWGKRSTAFVFVGLIVFVVGLRTVEWPTLGGGIIVKAGSLMGTFGTPFILVLVYFGLLVAILFSMSSDINAILTASFIGPFLLSSPMFQRYFEPSLLVSLFLFSDIKTAKSIFTESVLIANFIFYIIILMIGLIYYGLLGQGAPLTG